MKNAFDSEGGIEMFRCQTLSVWQTKRDLIFIVPNKSNKSQSSYKIEHPVDEDNGGIKIKMKRLEKL